MFVRIKFTTIISDLNALFTLLSFRITYLNSVRWTPQSCFHVSMLLNDLQFRLPATHLQIANEQPTIDRLNTEHWTLSPESGKYIRILFTCFDFDRIDLIRFFPVFGSPSTTHVSCSCLTFNVYWFHVRNNENSMNVLFKQISHAYLIIETK